jgi:hypothetical protein
MKPQRSFAQSADVSWRRPLDGLPMGTRPGQIDPGVLFYLIDQKQMSADQVQLFLYQDCGLKGLSGISNDVRELEASADPKAQFALDYFAYRVGLYAECWRPRSAASTASCSPPESAKTLQACARASRNGWRGSAEGSTDERIRRAREKSPP